MIIGRNDELKKLRAAIDSDKSEFIAVYGRRLMIKREVYRKETGTTSAIHLTMVSAHGLKENANANDVQSVVTQDDLFC